MDTEAQDHEERIQKLEHKVLDLACEIKLLREHMDAGFATLEAKLRAEFTAAITQAVTGLEERIQQSQRWVISLLVAVLLGLITVMFGMANILLRLA